MEKLATSAGAQVVGRFSQHLKRISPATLIGQGKIEEIQESIHEMRPHLIIFDENLSPAQQRNLELAFEVRVIDRSQLILDIFAQRARSNEGKLQVELAQLEYLLPRLTRRWGHLSRLGGGIGTRGPGETQLEVDRRSVRERIGTLRRRLRTVERTRDIQRQERLEVPYATVALIGYTNSGKSTLMNDLTRAGVMVVDTVGFINKIPHSLIEAFKSTLEEVRRADLQLHLVDMTSPFYEEQVQAVEAVLKDLGAGQIPQLIVPNKIDAVSEAPPQRLGYNRAYGMCPISARTGKGIDQLLDTVGRILDQGKERTELCFSPSQGSLLSLLRQRGRILEERYEQDRTHVTALLTPKLAGQMRKWLGENSLEVPG